ncbi:uncharacterized protein LOC126571174 isoform X1 [Anopheles aquasalis]|uniref:uncharacterized protein LOC126571174 isoform X1 n=1 Tax=Anopheles aquasalis TaxID=42839 RepID=UPI00215ACC47|nr:uncharacterized protein LOC126571174 isoform X1 [Anopheles aquasalis]
MKQLVGSGGKSGRNREGEGASCASLWSAAAAEEERSAKRGRANENERELVGCNYAEREKAARAERRSERERVQDERQREKKRNRKKRRSNLEQNSAQSRSQAVGNFLCPGTHAVRWGQSASAEKCYQGVDDNPHASIVISVRAPNIRPSRKVLDRSPDHATATTPSSSEEYDATTTNSNAEK